MEAYGHICADDDDNCSLISVPLVLLRSLDTISVIKALAANWGITAGHQMIWAHEIGPHVVRQQVQSSTLSL